MFLLPNGMFLKIRLFVFAVLVATCAHAQLPALQQLKDVIARREAIIKGKQQQIATLTRALQRAPQNNLQQRFKLAEAVYRAYQVFQFDSAYVYVQKMQQLSMQMQNQPLVQYSKCKLAYILLSAGLFKETLEEFKSINIKLLADSSKVEYYYLLNRFYFDMVDYNKDGFFAPRYKQLANQYLDSAIALSPRDNFNGIYLRGFKLFKNGQTAKAKQILGVLLQRGELNLHQKAIVAATICDLYPGNQARGTDSCMAMLALAAKCDALAPTTETTALFRLAEMLYKRGNTADAFAFLQIAQADADFYGARQRKVQISAILPVVAAAELRYTEREKQQFMVYTVGIALLSLVIVVFVAVLFTQLRALQAKEKIINDKNHQLERNNQLLLEGTRIKEEYIGQFFELFSGYILELERIKQSVNTRLALKKYNEIQTLIDHIDIKAERENLYATFDRVFLKIFPHFIEDFNALFKPEDQIWPKPGEVLNTDLRIFALIRMGVNDTATIANILEYTEKTIYVYKMRIRAKALVQGDKFDQQLMAIKAVDV